MSDDSVLEFYEALGFEETEIEDGLTALACELDADGSYALVTDEEGAIPETLKKAVVFACYTPEGAYLWSAVFKNSYVFKENWPANKTAEERVAAIRERRAGAAFSG